MAFGNVRKCPVCPAYWIEDDQMYEDPAVCPQCGNDSSDFMNQYARGKSGNLSRELLLNPGFEYFAGVIDDGKSNEFEHWRNYYVNDPAGKKVEAVSDCYKGGAAVKLSAASGTVRISNEPSHPVIIPGGNFRYSFWTKGDGGAGYVEFRAYPSEAGWHTVDTQYVTGIYKRFSGDVVIDPAVAIYYQFTVLGNGSCWIDAISLKKILTD